jgi:hypothetical protein
MSDDNEFIDVSFDKNGGVLKKITQAAPEGALGPPPRGNEIEAHYTGAFAFAFAFAWSCFVFYRVWLSFCVLCA